MLVFCGVVGSLADGNIDSESFSSEDERIWESPSASASAPYMVNGDAGYGAVDLPDMVNSLRIQFFLLVYCNDLIMRYM